MLWWFISSRWNDCACGHLLPSAATTRVLFKRKQREHDEILAALLVYGYSVLGLTLMLGALGMPFPSALSVVVAGSLAAQGQLSWLGAGAVVVASSVLG